MYNVNSDFVSKLSIVFEDEGGRRLLDFFSPGVISRRWRGKGDIYM